MVELLADSWARLEWVRTLVAKVAPFVAAIDRQGRSGNLNLAVAYQGEFEHARYTLARPIAIPDVVGFTIADIAVNARSCLDLAIQAIVNTYDLAVKSPQFPIENNVDKAISDRTKRLFDTLAPEFVEVLTDLQPSYEKPWGHVDIPVNHSALMIREISNANKHRNLTPAVRTSSSSGFTVIKGLELELVQEGSPSPWPADDTTVLEVRYPRGTATNEQLLALRPISSIMIRPSMAVSTSRRKRCSLSRWAASLRRHCDWSWITPMNIGAPSCSKRPTASWKGNSLPSLRRPRPSRPIPMMRFSPVS